MTLDDFEWVERGFDNYLLVHKKFEWSVAQVNNFNGWTVQVWKESKRDGPLMENALDLDAAKAVAMIYANKHMQEYEDAYKSLAYRGTLRKRAPEYQPEAVPTGVFKVDKPRS
jgi:hypothetical protein